MKSGNQTNFDPLQYVGGKTMSYKEMTFKEGMRQRWHDHFLNKKYEDHYGKKEWDFLKRWSNEWAWRMERSCPSNVVQECARRCLKSVFPALDNPHPGLIARDKWIPHALRDLLSEYWVHGDKIASMEFPWFDSVESA
jgi:hypothetical protein